MKNQTRSQLSEWVKMENYKVKVNNEAESKEVQELFFELGFEWKYKNIGRNYHKDDSIGFLYADDGCITTGEKVTGENYFKNHKDTELHKELTIPQLRDLVVLKRNDVGDVTHTCDGHKYYLTASEFFKYTSGCWENVDEYVDGCIFEPISKTKEYLDPDNGYALITADDELKGCSNWIEVPEGAESARNCGGDVEFYKDNFSMFFSIVGGYWESTVSTREALMKNIVWQRHTQPTEDVVDNVNHPLHYSSGSIECIDAIESSMSVEAFKGYLKGNAQKYMWRYEQKGGVESLEKAQWYLNKLVSALRS